MVLTEPVGSANSTLNSSEKSKHHPILSISHVISTRHVEGYLGQRARSNHRAGTYSQPLYQQLISERPTNQSKGGGKKKPKETGGAKTHLSVIPSTRRKQRLKRVVAGEQETGEINEELATDVEENKEKVHADQAEDHVDLWDGALALEVVEDGVFGELAVAKGS